MCMIEETTWDEFRDNGMLWWVNRQLQLFGYSIVVNMNEYGEVESAYPVKSKFRGFSEECETKGFQQLTKYLEDNVKDLTESTEDVK